ncbi:ABC transporter ATP-binding protein [Psychrilyobacter atlanticus]|uniref:ABC transporter ATP-binding protein n=1 Tax=Psychrilyobacter atlanticus TaxID=271091 RepID=UPI000400CF16|nr:ABC transporter ATP-binding protein [Psychrilyobacter atlanticus]
MNSMNDENQSIYRIKNLKKSYRKKEVLKNINLEIKRGEIITVIGKNGAGKSTLLKTMMGLISYDSGSIKFNNKEVLSYGHNLYKDLGVILEGQNNLYSYITAMDNLYYYGGLLGLKKREIKEKGGSLLKELDLYEHRNKKAGDLSTGMKQKLGIGVALLGTPKVLFLDEPTLGLDLISTKELIKKLKGLSKNHNISIILTSHEVSTVDEVSDRIAYLNNGEIEFCAHIDEFKKKFAKSKKVISVKGVLKNEKEFISLKQSYLNEITKIYIDEKNDSNEILADLIKHRYEILDFSLTQNELENAIINLSKGEKK